MKVQLSQIIGSRESMGRLIQEKLSAKTALLLARVVREINPEITSFEKINNDLIMNKYGTVQEDGVSFKVTDDNREDYYKEINSALNTEVELSVNKLPISLITCNMSAVDLLSLEWLIDSEEENKDG